MSGLTLQTSNDGESDQNQYAVQAVDLEGNTPSDIPKPARLIADARALSLR